jgi:hypothetical protein
MILPMENDPLIMAAAKARLVAPPTLAAVHCSPALAIPKRCLASLASCTYGVEDSQRCDDGVNEVDSGQDTGTIARWQERHERTADDTKCDYKRLRV